MEHSSLQTLTSVPPSLSIAVLCGVALSLWLAIRSKAGGLPYPPGPKGLPFIGNVLEVDLKEPHITYTRWAAQYGTCSPVPFDFSVDFVIISSEKIARHLADQRSTIYSDRPQSPLYKLFGVDRMTFLLTYCSEWKAHRKLLHLSLKPEAVDQYQDMYLSSARRLLGNLKQNGTKFREHFHLYTGAISLELTYGRRIEGKNDPIISLATSLGVILSEETTPEKSGLLMAFPLLRYLPAKMVHTLAELPYNTAKQQMESGVLPQCLVHDFLTHGEVEEASAKDAAAGVYLGLSFSTAKGYALTQWLRQPAAAESAAAILETLVLAMILYPDVQQKVHAELDAVLGKGNLPTFADRPRLPYLQAVLFELLRWQPVFPLGVPHATTTNDIYEGYYIPKGCIVIFNVWAMTRNCPDPERFDPTRHLTFDGQVIPQARQHYGIHFGFGRRVCPGRTFAEYALWAAAATMLSSLKFEKAKDARGNYIDIKLEFTHGQASHPLPFECSITDRLDD
ncbi:cytochrome P450 [Pisolithus orientalis]|uniref:cytochrome P450 n=1 Tax=Pisolithus orientalis TaxID=936130 RepID=UPI0022257E34|nr:cytochrome P450 [Pisolithus orientalis]KAI6006590.1 cytochrome P450 [Pisolithus orientalis]